MADYDLCSLAEVRSFLQKQSGDTGQDAIIQSLISRASKAIMRYTDREFAPATTAGTRKFEYDPCTGMLDLAPYDLRTVTSLILDSDEDTTYTLTTDEYRLAPKPNRDGTYQRIYMRPATLATAPWRFPDVREVSITGNWGFSSVPEDVKHACISTVAIWLRRDVSAFSTTFNITEDRVERPEFIPGAIRAQLDHWKRHLYG